jgi:hypothetical protein
MNANQIAIAAALLLAACQTDAARREDAGAPAKHATVAIAGKPQAPVQIDADVAASSARVTVRFDQAGTNVEVRANGVDGLSVAGDPVLARGRSVAAGETATFDVPFTAGPGQSMLAVHVRGAFASGERAAVRAFLVGKPSAEQTRKAQESKTTKVGGEDVRLAPAEQK